MCVVPGSWPSVGEPAGSIHPFESSSVVEQVTSTDVLIYVQEQWAPFLKSPDPTELLLFTILAKKQGIWDETLWNSTVSVQYKNTPISSWWLYVELQSRAFPRHRTLKAHWRGRVKALAKSKLWGLKKKDFSFIRVYALLVQQQSSSALAGHK